MTLRYVTTILLATLIALGPAGVQAQDQGSGKCSLKTLKGSYAFKSSGVLYSAFPPPGMQLPQGQVTLKSVGIVTFDGNGSVTMTSMNSFVGFILPSPPLNGTYAVEADCTGTIAMNDMFSDTVYFAIHDNGKGMFGLYTTLVDGGTKPGPSILLDFAKQ